MICIAAERWPAVGGPGKRCPCPHTAASDSALPLQTAFTGADAVVMLGAFPRKDGMERKDLLEKNCGIFKEQV